MHFFYAAREQQASIIEKLIRDYKIDAKCVNEDGESPEEFCRSIGDDVLARLISSLTRAPSVSEHRGRPADREVRQPIKNPFSLSAGSRFSWDTLSVGGGVAVI